jgi:ribosomal protein RSM22 (predicted rRNA methylase)
MSNQIPSDLKEAIQEELKKVPLGLLNKSREEFGTRYREEAHRKAITSAGAAFLDTEGHRLAYIATRMPATYAAVSRVFHEADKRLPDLNCESLLDLGAGPGTVLWACAEVFPSLKQVTMIEQDVNLIKIGKRLCSKRNQPLFNEAQWLHEDLSTLQELKPHDCIVLSYSLGELPKEVQVRLIDLCWKSARKAVILIEPGTPYGFEGIVAARERLIKAGAYIAAPCPHANACPLAAIGDWCHFSERLERTVEHRILKEGQLGYEDEKFSYLVASKMKGEAYNERILRHPQKRKGHIHFTLCTPEGLKQKIISKREGQAYKDAKKADWGDILS